jgi:hypothetical protein
MMMMTIPPFNNRGTSCDILRYDRAEEVVGGETITLPMTTTDLTQQMKSAAIGPMNNNKLGQDYTQQQQQHLQKYECTAGDEESIDDVDSRTNNILVRYKTVSTKLHDGIRNDNNHDGRSAAAASSSNSSRPSTPIPTIVTRINSESSSS